MDGPGGNHTLVSYVHSGHRTVEFSCEAADVSDQTRQHVREIAVEHDH